MSKPVVSVVNMDNKSAVYAIIDYAGEFVASITLEDIPRILKDIIDNLKSVGKYVIDQIKDFVLNDFWGLILDTKDIIKSLLNQYFDKALNCASRALEKLEKVLDILSYIPCLAVAIGIILIVIYICQLDFVAIASAVICMIGPLKILTKIFPKSRTVINKLVEFLVDFGKRFKDQVRISLKKLVKKSSLRIKASNNTYTIQSSSRKFIFDPNKKSKSELNIESGQENFFMNRKIDNPDSLLGKNLDVTEGGLPTNNIHNSGFDALLNSNDVSRMSKSEGVYNPKTMYGASRDLNKYITNSSLHENTGKPSRLW